ncbi:Mediator of RNA polymerase II transcription subunit 7 [Fusarium falciforme]|uniref:Mediator of RNA polymerase II transcription subunit 7 n=1 Tax=Fusarium falciforme TaxID=195108 RepID=A0A9W8R309_9HYPO|nr:Mediator of RNA polymerase II transcription subunit 7 [Fusarium falciforme]KAJ4160300.1 Mediator of RNA polymerase II transcription subunit 7 [Fusarium falciforme]KAJ4183983.1 Mediator of RNA polymerase II transcription subunit 7 [Fusarium falciforme]KAJ4200088.1 Mediator of RNA polymerase II transcription subunit 7 [Fusarium falciforme]KAJ4248174.1 Mediator of RNA polymerase II transcription subunit 7 [Fusarium falciforme]WAO85872.1 Mediator of RNA polymerase II transcription subunit 7 [Fu
MAEQQEPHSLSSTFPNPPPFWKDFTPENLSRIEALRTAHLGQHEGEPLTVRVPDVPEDLINLQPPAEPADGRWRVFGDQYMLDDKLPTLEEQGIINLPSTTPSDSKDVKHFDRAFELKRLAKSLLLNFLELTGTLAQNPEQAEAKVQDLRTLFINFHHILNEYRPHQARESVIALMQEHLDRTRTETMAIRTQVDKARRVLDGLGSLSVPDVPKPLGQAEAQEDYAALAAQREADVWAATDAMFT